jgi:hypothetical protein
MQNNYELSFLFQCVFCSPRVISDLNAQDGVYVFPTDKLQSPCSTDVSIHTGTERTIKADPMNAEYRVIYQSRQIQ